MASDARKFRRNSVPMVGTLENWLAAYSSR